MNLDNRLKQLEKRIVSQHHGQHKEFDFDGFVRRVGLDPAAVRQSAISNNDSLVGTVCGMVGVDVKEFRRYLQEGIRVEH